MEDWKKKLTPEQYEVCRKGATERPFSGKYYRHYEKGTYHCACCELPLFRSEEKYDSGSGWPSYWAPFDPKNLITLEDRSHGMIRTEIKCAKCEAHLGHVFEDGPAPTYQRFCINSLALKFIGSDSG